MDWKSLKNKALDFSTKAMEASTKALEKGIELVEKAKDTGESLKDKVTDITEKVIDTKDSIAEKIENTKEVVIEKKDGITEKIDETKNKIQEKKEEFSEKASEIKENISEKKEEVSGNSKSFLDKAKSFGSKAMDSTTGVLAKTAPTLKIIADYEKIKDDKNLAILFLKKDTEESKKLQLMMPLFVKNCWTNMITFKVVDIEDSKELAQNFDLEIVPSLIVFQLGEEKLRTGGFEEIKKYFKDFLI